MKKAHRELLDILTEARLLLARPYNNFDWSSWADTAAALREVDELISAMESDRLPSRFSIATLFAPTGPIQEVSISSGWGDEFLSLADRCDDATESLYGQRWWRRLLNWCASTV